MAKREINMLRGPLFKNIILYTIPIILTSVLQLLFNAADLVVVGNFGANGSDSVAAVGATGAITNLIVNMFMGLSVGSGVTVAHALGAHDSKGVHRVVHTALPTALVSGITLSVIGIIFSENFLVLMGTHADILPLSTLYMRIYFAGMTFNMVYNYGASILRAAGDTKSPLIFLALAGVINVLLNLVFVIVLHMDVAGVALATTTAQAISAVLVVMALMRRNDSVKFDPRKMRFHSKALKKMLIIGIPSGVQGSLFSISNVLIQSSVNSFGKVFMAGNAAAGNIEGFVWVIMNAFHQTALNFCGQNEGARQHKRVKKVLFICLGLVTLFGFAAGGLVYLFGKQLLSIYIPDSAQAIQYGLIRFGFVALPYFLCGLMDVTTGAIRGIGASISPMIITVLGVCGFRIGWILTIFKIEQFHTPECLYFSYPISWLATFLFELLAFYIIYKRRVKAFRLRTAKKELTA